MVKKIKCPSCGPNWCQNHVFQLNPLKSYLYFKKKIKLRLCPKHNKAYNTFDNALPVLNVDHKHYTPLFILQQQKKFYNQHDQRAKFNHQKLIERQWQNESYFTIYEAKHGGQRPYCSVCQKGYFDYNDHINSHDHKKNLQSSIFTRYIMQIQQNLKKKQKEEIEAVKPLDQKQVSKSVVTQLENDYYGCQLQQSEQKNGSSQSIQKLQKHTLDLDKLEMQHMQSHYVDTTTLKQIDQVI